MNILSRFAEIMSANINAFLEQMEGRNADKLLQKYILDAENDLGQIKSQTAAVMAEEKKAQRRLEECEAEIEKYGRYAVSAVRQGDDNDARKFLSYQKELEQKKMGLEELADTISSSALCGLGKTAASPVKSTLKYFRDEYIAHVAEKTCPAGDCKALKRIYIDKALCKGCSKCQRNCPVGAISGKIKEPFEIDSSKCIKCGACVAGCPFKAIKEA